jgi:hypothetical protein
VNRKHGLWPCAALVLALTSYGSVDAASAAAESGGSISGTIALDDRGSDFPAGMGIRVTVKRAGTNSPLPIGVAHLRTLTVAKDGTRTIRYTVSELPLGVLLDVMVDPVPAAGATPLPRAGFVSLASFRPKGYRLTLTDTNRNAIQRDFAVYMLEVIPAMPPPSSPARTQ